MPSIGRHCSERQRLERLGDELPHRTRLRVGDKEAAVHRAYSPLRQEGDIYGEEGDKLLFFDVGRGQFGMVFAINAGRVSSITVGGSSRGYIEGCL
jgi:hypothetical protein